MTPSRTSATTTCTARTSSSRGSSGSTRWPRARETYVITNNHFNGQAAVNAAMLRKLYGRADVEVPAELMDAYRAVLEPLGIGTGGEPTLDLR